MDKRDITRRRYEGYYEGSSGRTYQQEWDDLYHDRGPYSTYGDEARWKNSIRAEHINNDDFGRGTRNRGWTTNLSNYGSNAIHYGKGPKGYERPPERIYEDVCELLLNNPDINASEIEVNVQEGIVTLSGTVENRHMKRLTERCIDHVLGVEDVINLITLRS